MLPMCSCLVFLLFLTTFPICFIAMPTHVVINLKDKKIRKNTCREIISIQTHNLISDPKATLSCDHRYYIRNGFFIVRFPDRAYSCWLLKSPTLIFLSDVCRAIGAIFRTQFRALVSY